MRRRIYIIVPLLGLVAFAAGYAHWKTSRSPRVAVKGRAIYPWISQGGDGTRDAEDALRRGRHSLLVYGLLDDDATDYQAVLREDYGVTTNVIAGCVVDDDLLRYANAYNAVMRRDLQQRFGADIFKVAEAKAAARYVARNHAAAPE